MGTPKPKPGARVMLTRDVTTRGGRVFRAGVVMRVVHTHRGYHLAVSVRARWFFLTLEKKYVDRYLRVVTPAPPPPPEQE